MTIITIIVTILISIYGFQNKQLFDKLLLNPYRLIQKKEFYRVITHGFIHADWTHLLVNMFVLFSFGKAIELYLGNLKNLGYIQSIQFHFILLYLGGIIVSSLPSIIKHRNDSWYNSLGASGGVSSVVFASIFFDPLNIIYLYFIPIPGIIFGILYLVYSQYMSKRNKDNVNHEAHFTGAVFGFVYPLIIHPGLIKIFLSQLHLL